MKKNAYIGVAFIILIFGIYAVPEIIERFKTNEVVKTNDKVEKFEKIKDSNPKLVTISKAPQFELTNQDEETISNSFYKNKVYVVDFFFTTCPTICPKMTKNMLKVQNKFYENPNFGIVSISINPNNDTPQVLKDYAKEYGATLKNWHFLTGDKDYIYTIANNGFTLYAGENSQAEGGFEHSGSFALIDKKGNIRSRFDTFGNPIAFYDGLSDEGIKMIIEDIEVLLKE